MAMTWSLPPKTTPSTTYPGKLSQFGAAVQPVQVDLRGPEGVERLYESAVEGDRVLAAAALNAGIGRGEMFLKSELADDLSIIDLNVRSTVHLAKLVLRDMANRNAGKVLLTSSIASQMPGSYQPVYNASKSFIQSFAQALHDELRDTAITVTALMPGPTDTNFFGRAKMVDSLMGKMRKDDPAEVARQGFEALMQGDQKVVAGSALSKVMGAANRVLPDTVKAVGNRVMSKPRGN